VPPFDRVELAGSNNVAIRVGGEQSVVVHADDNLVDRVTTHVYGSNLVIGNVEGSFTTTTPMRVEVTVPRLDELTLSGSGTIDAAGIDSKTLTVTLPGSGVVSASGRTDAVVATLGGSGTAQLQELVAQDAHAVVNGSGQILVTATHVLDASVPGSGTVFYRGNPEHVKTTVTGSGAVTRG
jgi:Putative auto-transporter adhesin, head GIN domain